MYEQNIFYIDFIFIINFILNFFILYDTAKIVKEKINFYKLAAASALGALYFLTIFFPSIHVMYTLVIKLATSVVIIIVAFTPHRTKRLISLYLWFFIVSLIYGAAAFMALFLIHGVKGLHIIYIYNYPSFILIMASLAAHFLITYLNNFLKGKLVEESIFIEVTIQFNGLTKKIKALVDTGNSLVDPLTNRPAIVVSYFSLESILPTAIDKNFIEEIEKDIQMATKLTDYQDWAHRFRLIPYSSIGKDGGFLIGFKPDYVTVHHKDKEQMISNVIICVTTKKFNKSNEFDALVSPMIFKYGEVAC